MKNDFYFTLKDLFILKIFKSLSSLLVMKKTRLIRNIRLISKFTTLQPWKQSRDNQTIRFVQLIEYKMRNIFLEKSYIKCDKETILRFKNQY